MQTVPIDVARSAGGDVESSRLLHCDPRVGVDRANVETGARAAAGTADAAAASHARLVRSGFDPWTRRRSTPAAWLGMTAVLASVLCATHAHADASRRGIGISPRPLQVAWAPDGRLAVAFSYSNQVRIFDADGTPLRTLTVAPAGADARDPSWSPDGTRLAFTEGPYPDSRVVVAAADGSSVRLFGPGSAPVWSPDGTLLAYTELQDELRPEVWIARADGTEAHRLTDGAPRGWSPTGAWLAVVRSDGTWIVSPDGTTARRLSSRTGFLLWSPDGEAIAQAGESSVEVLRLDGSTLELAPGTPLSWSPSGDRIAISGCCVHGQTEFGTTIVDLARNASTLWSQTIVSPAPDWREGAAVIQEGRDGQAVYLLAPGDTSVHRLVFYTCPRRSTVCRQPGDGSDRIIGTERRDLIFPGAGDDVVFAHAGHDRVDAAFGNDAVSGGRGNDVIFGQSGDDRLDGGPGDDILVGGPGRDRITGGKGADTIFVSGDGTADVVRCVQPWDSVFADEEDRVTSAC